MLNQDKFKTADERVKAFDEWCKRTTSKKPCMYVKTQKCMNCFAHWLALEAEDEKPENCPFCGESVSIGNISGTDAIEVRCERCGYHSCEGQDVADAIAAHNRVARAVRVARESEVK